ncbi:MAG: hypothetical protein QG626_762 [Patescibacteria group bacterium]|nr:hypothetical protein [Patescibacteria group bacterium]
MTKSHTFITFNGEFPGDLLNPLRELATLLAPYDQAAYEAPPEELMTYLEILELDDKLSEQFMSLTYEGSIKILEFARSMKSEKASFMERRLERLFMKFDRISNQLRKAGYPLTASTIVDIAQGYRSMEWVEKVHDHGIDHVQNVVMRLMQNTELSDAAYATAARIGWLFCAKTAIAPTQELLNPSYAAEIFQLLRYIDIDYLGHGSLAFKVNSLLPGILPAGMILEVFPAREPWSLCGVCIRRPGHTRAIALGAISRLNGEITNFGCIGVSVSFAFEAFMKTVVYEQLRDIIIFLVYSALTEGIVSERVLMQNMSNDTEECAPEAEQIVSAEVTRTDTQGIPDVLEFPIPCSQTKAPLLIGKSKYTWRNLVATFRQFGAELIPGGKHPKIVLGDRSAVFLNPHGRENPRHNKRVLRETLLTLGIDEQEFVARL